MKAGRPDAPRSPDKIYTRHFTGRFRNLRRLGAGLLFLVFFATPWLDWGTRQAVLLDLPKRQFHIFATTFWPQDFILLSWLLIICAFGLFTITVLAGRLWCGYTCPQSVFTWVFIWVEHRLEGDRNRRMQQDRQPSGWPGRWRKLAKHLIWLAIALATAFTFVGYFTPIKALAGALINGTTGGWSYFWLGFFTLATYGNAGWLREQVCLHMCPYARFQSVMFDRQTLVVAYDPQRGEPRGSRKRQTPAEELKLGHCIDCTVCVQVCPTGIDIRNGLQYQCIGCAACIDACDSIMDKMGYPRGLVRYTTEESLAGGRTRLLRPRLLGYSGALLTIVVFFILTLANRVPLELEALHERNPLYRIASDGQIENTYIIKVANKSQQTQQVRLQVSGIPGVQLRDARPFSVSAGEVTEQVVRVSAPHQPGAGTARPIIFTVGRADSRQMLLETESRFIAPGAHLQP